MFIMYEQQVQRELVIETTYYITGKVHKCATKHMVIIALLFTQNRNSPLYKVFQNNKYTQPLANQRDHVVKRRTMPGTCIIILHGVIRNFYE